MFTESWCMVNRRKTKARFNLFDVFVIAVIVAALGIVLVLAGGLERTDVAGQPVEVSYQLELTYVGEEYKDSARVGDIVKDGVRKTELGEITSVKVSPMTAITTNPDTGEVLEVDVPGKYKVILTCKANGNVDSGRVAIGSFTLGVGTEVFVQTYGISGRSFCIGVSYEEVSS